MTDRKAQAAAAFRSGVHIHEAVGAPLYAALCAHCADDPDMVDLASRGQPLQNLQQFGKLPVFRPKSLQRQFGI